MRMDSDYDYYARGNDMAAERAEYEAEAQDEQDYADELAQGDAQLEASALAFSEPANDDDVTEVFELAQTALAIEDLRSRMDLARLQVLRALKTIESGHTMPYAAIDSMLTSALCQLGCVACGKKFDRDDASTLCCVRHHGVHSGDCGAGGAR